MSRTRIDRAVDALPAMFRREVDRQTQQAYEPTGLQEDIIIPFGNGDFRIVYTNSANKIGKTATGANILRNIAFERDEKFFDYPMFNKWPYPKQGRIIGTSENIGDSGPIQTELRRWMPMDRVTYSKGGKNWNSEWRTNTGHSWTVMSYKQDPADFEGPLLGWTWCDEPPPAKLMGAIMSRFMKGGILFITATPIGDNLGAFLDVLDDLESGGHSGKRIKVARVSGDLRLNSITEGKANHLGRKRGLMTNTEIDIYEASIPIDQRDARVHGIADHRAGKIYPEFDRMVHVEDLEMDCQLLKDANCYPVMDPHRKYYPAVQFWAHTSDERHILYNEWPTREFLGAYYHEVRKNLPCPYPPDKIAQFLRVNCGRQYGLTMTAWGIDPWFAKGTQGEGGRTTESIQTEYVKHQIEFEMPPFEHIDVQRDVIRNLLRWDALLARSVLNMPEITVLPRCQNSIRAFERHFWLEGKEKESEDYKDFMDCARIYFALLGGRKWTPNRGVSSVNKLPDATPLIIQQGYFAHMKETALA